MLVPIFTICVLHFNIINFCLWKSDSRENKNSFIKWLESEHRPNNRMLLELKCILHQIAIFSQSLTISTPYRNLCPEWLIARDISRQIWLEILHLFLHGKYMNGVITTFKFTTRNSVYYKKGTPDLPFTFMLRFTINASSPSAASS